MKNLFRKFVNRETVLYLIFGVLTTLVDALVFWAMNRIIGVKYYLLNHTISFVVAVLFAYFTNKSLVFNSIDWSGKNVMRELISFFGGRLFTFGVGVLLLVIAEEVFHASDYVLYITNKLTFNGLEIVKYTLIAVITIVLNYLFSKLLVFRKRPSAGPTPAEPEPEEPEETE